ncbi:MAG: aspartate aminotransferase family protein [Chordicoccus sp.]
MTMTENPHTIYDEAARVWNPNKVDVFRRFGMEMVMGEREGCTFSDLSGHTYINMHSNGGVFNLGHKNPEVMQALIDGAGKVDAGNHYFPSAYKNHLCEQLLAVSPASMKYVYFNNGGGESIDAAVKFARRATKRRRLISLSCAFHGSTGIAMEASNPMFAHFWNMDADPDLYTHIPYNDLNALEEVLKKNDTAAVLIESIPATEGFPLPIEGYHKSVQELAHRYGAMYIADEVQTGLMRSGQMWCCVKFGAEPDMIVTGKGLSGGYYPMSAVIMNEQAGQWLKEDGFAQVSSFNASEIGCIVSSKAMEIMTRPSTADNVAMLSDLFAGGLADIQSRHPDFLKEVRQVGVIMGLKTAHPLGGIALMIRLVSNGVWAVFADYDKSTLQFKPGLLMPKPTAEKVLSILDKSLTEAEALSASGELEKALS